MAAAIARGLILNYETNKKHLQLAWVITVAVGV